jgi:chemotaxis response regulator CheB
MSEATPQKLVVFSLGSEEYARAVRAAGGRILAEAQETCTIYGMPRAVAEAE